MKRKLDDLDQHIAVQGEGLFCMEITVEEIQFAFFEQEVEPVRDEVEALRWDIELHMDTSDYEEIEYAVECLGKAVGLLRGMCNEELSSI